MTQISVSPLFLRGAIIQELVELRVASSPDSPEHVNPKAFIFEITSMDRQYQSPQEIAAQVYDRLLIYLPREVRQELAKGLAHEFSEKIVDTSKLKETISKIDTTCPACRGSGMHNNDPCENCNGTGQKLVRPIKPPSNKKPGLKPCRSK